MLHASCRKFSQLSNGKNINLSTIDKVTIYNAMSSFLDHPVCRNIYIQRSKNKSHQCSTVSRKQICFQQTLEVANCRVGLPQWGRQTVPKFRSSDLESPKTAKAVWVRGPHKWRHEMNGADGGRHPRQVCSRRTSSEALNHAATCIRARPTHWDTSLHRQPVEPSQDWRDVVWPAGSRHQASYSMLDIITDRVIGILLELLFTYDIK